MGFFRKLFGGDEPRSDLGASEVPPTQPLGDPYRGVGSVQAIEERAVPPAATVKPILDAKSQIFALERGHEVPLRSLTYCGKSSSDISWIRRVSFGIGGVAVDWEHRIGPEDARSNRLITRVDDRIIVPGVTGVIALHLVTGEPCWELPHPSTLFKAPVRDPDGALLFVFRDQTWIKVLPRDGSFRAEGRVHSDLEAQELLDRGRPAVPPPRKKIRYGGHVVSLAYDRIRVEVSDKDDDATEITTTDYGRSAPTAGEYPIDGWKPGEYLDIVGDKLAAWLSKEWGDRNRVAIGLFDPTSLEPLRLIELGDCQWLGFKRAYTVDDLLVVALELLPPAFEKVESRVGFHAHCVVDTRSERVLACLASDISDLVERPSFLFDAEGRQIWRNKL